MLLAVGLGLWWTGAIGELADRERIRAWVDGAGVFAPLVFIALVTGLFPFMLGGVPIWLSSGFWPIPLAIAYSFVASLVASIVFFAMARRLGQDWAAHRIPDRLRAHEAKLEAHPLRTVMVLRLLLWINPAIDILVGMSGVSTRSYLLGTVIVLVPTTIFNVVAPAKGMEWAAAAPDWVWLGAGAVALALAAGVVAHRLLRGRAAAS